MSGAKANHFQGSLYGLKTRTLQGSDLLSTSAVSRRGGHVCLCSPAPKPRQRAFALYQGSTSVVPPPGQKWSGV